jgi:hypothetical protein
MKSIPVPDCYGSIEELSDWLKRNIPHEFDVDGGVRWMIITGYSDWRITFVRDSDATYFNLKWPSLGYFTKELK